MFHGILLSKFQDIEGIDDTPSRVLWHFMKQLYKFKDIPWWESIHS